jgi:hypothetical protein
MLTRIEVCTLLEEVITYSGDDAWLHARFCDAPVYGVPYSTRQIETTVTRLRGPALLGFTRRRAARGPGRAAISSARIASPTASGATRGDDDLTTTSIHAATTLEPRDTRRHQTRHCADAPCMSCSLRRNIPGTPAARAAERVTRTIHKVTTHEVTTRESRRPCGASDRSITVASSCLAQLP